MSSNAKSSVENNLCFISLKSKGIKVSNEVNKNLTLNEVEKKICKNLMQQMADRGTSIKDLNKTIGEIVEKNPSKVHTFFLLDRSEGIINDLENSEINAENGNYFCYVATYLQLMIKHILPEALKKLNKERESRGEKPIDNLEEIKIFDNDNCETETGKDFYNAVIDTAIEVCSIQAFGNGGVDKNGNKKFRPTNVWKMEETNTKFDIYARQGLQCEKLINEAIIKFAQGAKEKSKKKEEEDNEKKRKLKDILNINNPPKKKFQNNSIQNEELIKIFEITKPTIISDVMKIKIDNKFYLNIVLNFDEKTKADKNLNIITLLENCQQLKKDNFTKKRIQETSEIIYMIVDRISSGEAIVNNFILYENIYLDKNIGFFTRNPNSNSILYELKFIIYHSGSLNSGHFTAYSKFRGGWHYFNSCNGGYAERKVPPLINFTDVYPVCIFYIKNEENNKDSEDCIIF